MKKINALLLTAAMGMPALGASAAENEWAGLELDQPQRVVTATRTLPNNRSLIWIVDKEAHEDIWLLKDNTYELYESTRKKGFQQAHTPNLIISDRSNRVVFGFGGMVQFRTSYDFHKAMPGLDFVPFDIPFYKNIDNKQKLGMDVSTSRLFMRSMIDPDCFLGPIEAYIDVDFRNSRNTGYGFGLREAYVSFLGFTFGKTVSTFTDLLAAPTTIDYQGPNAYTYRRNLMIQWKTPFTDNWDFAIALELPEVSATPGVSRTHVTTQRVPDIPAYVQYSWNDKRSHVRASGLLRVMNYVDEPYNLTLSKVGWGAQLSANIALGEIMPSYIFGQVTYGEGISNYIRDLEDHGMDMVAHGWRYNRMQKLPSLAWMVGAQINFSPDWQMNLTYSQVNLYSKNGYFAQNPGTQYRFGQYIVANAFYKITPSLKIGAEYLYGTRKNAGTGWHHSNRAQMMIQYNF